MKLITLSRGLVAKVDDDDYVFLSDHKWYASRGLDRAEYYARRNIVINGKRTNVRMHRVIMGVHGVMEVDHINHDTLDNRKCNLRVASHSQNQMNRIPLNGCSSKYKGVHWHIVTKKYHVRIYHGGKSRHLGASRDEETAARIYDKAAKKLFGEFAVLNMGDKNVPF